MSSASAAAPGGGPRWGRGEATEGASRGDVVITGAHDALIVVDVQQDFCAGGSLPVPGGDEVIPVINRIVPYFGRWIYTRDWHPADHASFSESPEFRDGSWPPHCVQGTPGSDWCKNLDMPMNAILVTKGDDPRCETYSGFQVARLDLAAFLHGHHVDRIFIAGLATEYCVRQTALDACAAGFTVYLVEDGIRGITKEGTEHALAEMREAGAIIIRSDQLEDSGERPAPVYDEHGNPMDDD